jgi:hypothetical protein
MEDLDLTVRLLEASSKLKRASSLLDGVATGERPEANEADTMKWVGDFLSSMDWSAEGGRSHMIPTEMVPQVISIRPMFFTSLLSMEKAFKKEELATKEDLLKFFQNLYAFLKEPLDKEGGFKPLGPRDSRLASTLLATIAQAIMTQLNQSDQPSPPELFIPVWGLETSAGARFRLS